MHAMVELAFCLDRCVYIVNISGGNKPLMLYKSPACWFYEQLMDGLQQILTYNQELINLGNDTSRD